MIVKLGVVHSYEESVNESDSKALVKKLGIRYEKMVFERRKFS